MTTTTAAADPPPGWVYTIHLHTRLGGPGRNGALHYTGWACDHGLLGRLLDHRHGHGAAMLAWCAAAGITWHLGALQRGDRALERRLKQHGAARRCWTCQAARDRA